MVRPPQFPPAPPIPPVKPGTPTQQPSVPSSSATANLTTGLPTQPINTQDFPNLDESVHPSVHLAVRVLKYQIADLQGGIRALQQQLLGGAVATAALGSGATAGELVAVTVQSGGYYLVTPIVTFVGGGFTSTPQGHAVLTGNRVTSVVIDNPGAGGSSVPQVVFTLP